jgi:hypothetical protein
MIGVVAVVDHLPQELIFIAFGSSTRNWSRELESKTYFK